MRLEEDKALQAARIMNAASKKAHAAYMKMNEVNL